VCCQADPHCVCLFVEQNDIAQEHILTLLYSLSLSFSVLTQRTVYAC